MISSGTALIASSNHPNAPAPASTAAPPRTTGAEKPARPMPAIAAKPLNTTRPWSGRLGAGGREAGKLRWGGAAVRRGWGGSLGAAVRQFL